MKTEESISQLTEFEHLLVVNLIKLTKETHNDMDLGKEVRVKINHFCDLFDIKNI